MIDLTGEMLRKAKDALAPNGVTPPGLVRALRDVLDEVEQDYVVTRRPAPPREAAA